MDTNLYIKGFNSAYLLATYEPAVLRTVVKGLMPINPYVEGLLDGKSQFALEKEKQQLVKMHGLREKSRDNTRDLDQER